jgi:uncharacterized membrane protein YgcG
MPGEFAGFLIVALVLVVIIGSRIVRGVRGARDAKQSRARQEALFQATFPELQPYFHPEKVLEFVKAWGARDQKPPRIEWNKPPGLGLAKARIGPRGDKGRRPVELLDEAGTVVSRLFLENQPDGNVLRIGPGKLTVSLRDAAVRYWHPEREFKWSRLKGWRVISSLSDRPIESSDRGTSFSSSSDSPSMTSSAAAVAGAAAVTGAGGAFDGGGSSDSWDDGSASRTSY